MRRFAAALLLSLLLPPAAGAGLPSATDAMVRQALSSGRPVVIDLGAGMCVSCRKMSPMLESLARDYRGRAGVLFIDVHEDQAAAEKFHIRMIPTQIFFNSHGREVKRHFGPMERAEIERELKAAGSR